MFLLQGWLSKRKKERVANGVEWNVTSLQRSSLKKGYIAVVCRALFLLGPDIINFRKEGARKVNKALYLLSMK